MASPSPVFRFLSSSPSPLPSCRTAIARSKRMPQPLRRNSHFFACDRQRTIPTRAHDLSTRSRSSASRSYIQRSWEGRRHFSATAASRHGHLDPPKPGEERKVTFIDKDGDKYTFEVSDGDNLLDIAQANDLEMEGACGGSCACSTCHVIVESDSMYDAMPEPEDDENDMLDLAFGLTETSRLGCQVVMTPELDGLVVRLPSMTRNLQASDFVEKKG